MRKRNILVWSKRSTPSSMKEIYPYRCYCILVLFSFTDPGHCSSDTSVCLMSSKNTSFAIDVATTSSRRLHLNRIVYLDMTGGKCSHRPSAYRTVINFICDTSAGIGSPQFVGDSEVDCLLIFVWRTSHACTPLVSVHAHTCKN